MPEFGGLQIEIRCVRCSRLSATDVTLYEMQNHLYICNYCRQEVEQRGKHIAWVDDARMETLPPLTPSLAPMPASAPTSTPTMTPAPARTRQLTGQLPPESIWARMDVPLDMPLSQIKQAVKVQLQLWSKKPDSKEKRNRVSILRECMEQLQDEEAFEEERERLRTISRKEGSALPVGGQAVLTAEEFLNACEKTQKGWDDGVRYLRTGELSQWILFQLNDRELAIEARNYQKRTDLSDFRALNEMLYCLVPTRAFRLYKQEKWQELDTVPQAEMPQDLAQLCDIHWNIAVLHLYEGSMLYWLEHSRGIHGLQAYYGNAVQYYANKGQDRGVGLELMLERAVPELEKPQLVVEFDGNRDAYRLKNWDREIPHKEIPVTITNVTRGYTSLQIELQKRPGGANGVNTIAPDWIFLYSSTALHGRPGAGMPGTARLQFDNLARLERGRTYRRKLFMRVYGENGQAREQSFPVELKTMSFFRGMRGRLWAWGLRGNVPGLAWNALAGGLLALLVYWLVPAFVPGSFSSWTYQLSNGLSFGLVLQAILVGVVDVLRFDGLIPGHPLAFPLVVAVLFGIVGFFTGWGKGHEDYQERRNASGFRKGAFWLALIYLFYLLYPDGGYSAIGQALQYSSNNYDYYQSYKDFLTVNAIQSSVSAILVSLLIFLLACLLASVHYRLERYLRYQNRALLDPPGKR